MGKLNCLIGVRDRHAGNFVISLATETVYSVDNEEGPFDSNNNLIDVRFIANQIRTGIERFFRGDFNDPLYKQNFKQGFIEGWTQVVLGFSLLHMFNQNEQELIRNSITNNPELVFDMLFLNW